MEESFQEIIHLYKRIACRIREDGREGYCQARVIDPYCYTCRTTVRQRPFLLWDAGIGEAAGRTPPVNIVKFFSPSAVFGIVLCRVASG